MLLKLSYGRKTMRRLIVCAIIAATALFVLSCQGKGRLLPGINTGPNRQAADFELGNGLPHPVWPMMGSTPDNTRHRYVSCGYEGPDPNLGGIGKLWDVRVDEYNDVPIYSSPVVHLGWTGAPPAPPLAYWEDIFVVAANGNLYALAGWDRNNGQQQLGEVFGSSSTAGPGFVVASAGASVCYDAGGGPPLNPEGSFNSIVFCDGSGTLRYYYSNGHIDGLFDPTFGQDGDLAPYINFQQGSNLPVNIGGDYIVSDITVDNSNPFQRIFYTGTYFQNALPSDPAGRLHSVTIGPSPGQPLATCWTQGQAQGVPLAFTDDQQITHNFDTESMMCFAEPGSDVFVVGRARPHSLNRARLFVYDNETGQQLAVSQDFDWFDEADYGTEPGMRSSPVIEDDNQHADIVYIYLAAPHGDRDDPNYQGDRIKEFTYSYSHLTHQWTLALTNDYSIQQLMAGSGTLPPWPFRYIAASPALVWDESTLVVPMNQDPHLFQGWKLFAFNMNNARQGGGALIATSEPMNGRCDSSPAIDSADNVWVSSDDELHRFEDFVYQGGPQVPSWSSGSHVEIDGRIWGSPSIGYTSQIDPAHTQHTAYIATDTGYVYAFADNIGALPPPPIDPIWQQQGKNCKHHFYQDDADQHSYVYQEPEEADLGDASWSDPAITENGDVYVTTTDGVLHAYYVDGSGDLTERWAFDDYDRGSESHYRDSFCLSSPAIGRDGTIYYIHPDAMLVAVNPNGTEKWTGDFINYDIALQPDPPANHKWMCALPSPIVWNNPNGDLIYAASYDFGESRDTGQFGHPEIEPSYLYCFDANGNLLGSVTTEQNDDCRYPTAPAVVPSLNRLYLVSYQLVDSELSFRLISFNASSISSGPLASAGPYPCINSFTEPIPTAVQHGDGHYRVYTVVDGWLYSFNEDLTAYQPPLDVPSYSFTCQGLTYDPLNELLYLATGTTGGNFGQVFAYSLDLGTTYCSPPLDEGESPSTSNCLTTEVTADTAGYIYVATPYRIHVLKLEGGSLEEQWSWSGSYKSDEPGFCTHGSSPAIDHRGRLYTATKGGKFVVFTPQ